MATVVFDAATNAAWSGTETTGASAYDTASVSTSDGFTATGTVSYTFFANGGCSGSGTGAGAPSLTATGSVPNSSTEGPLAAGSYSSRAVYSGDSNYAGSTSPCEPFSVTAPPTKSQITPTGTTCSQFSGGTASTLSTILYGVKSGTINNVSPGVFFYWVQVTAPAGSNSYTITQSISTASRIFLVASGSNAYDASCNPVKGTTITQSSSTGAVTVTFNAGSGGTFF